MDGGVNPARTFEYEDLPYSPTIPSMWHYVVEHHADNDLVVSLTDSGSSERITYRDADRLSAELARSLLAGGVGKGTRVGILAPNGPDFLVAFLATTRIGAVAVPVNTFFQPPELGWILRHADVHTLLTVPTLLGHDVLARIESAVPGLADAGAGPHRLRSTPALRHVTVLGDGTGRSWVDPPADPVSEEMLAATESAVREADELMVIYTSGSTAEPKGIIHEHGPAVRHSQFISAQHEWDPSDRVYIPMAFFWVGGLVFGVLGPMQIGVTIVTEHRFEPGPVLGLLARERVTYATGFPHVGPALASHPDFASTDLSSIRGGYQPVLVPEENRPPDPTLRVAQLGMTETCSSHTWWPPHESVAPEQRGSLGVSGPGFEHKVIDDEGRTVEPGVIGEICVRGQALMRGMVGRSRTEVFDRDGWYHTGDSGSIAADGHLYFAGRTDDMIKTSGANVAPIEVEGILSAMDEVRVAYVVGVQDPDKGAVVTAAVVLVPGAEVEPDELRARCREQLAAYKVPKRWIMLPDADPLPYTSTNKIDKRALVQLIDDGRLEPVDA